MNHQLPMPTAGNAPTPLWLAILVGILCFWGLMDLDRNAGDFQPDVFAPFTSRQQVEAANPRPATDPQFELGRGVYYTYCISCHQADGQGNALQAPPLAGSDWVLAAHPARIIRLVLHGMQGPITVNGKAYAFNNVMLPWKDALDDRQIAAVLTYLRKNPEWGHRAQPVVAGKVSEIRKSETRRANSWTEAELLKIPLDN
jgi:mono/diheme cytochrome c family protein